MGDSVHQSGAAGRCGSAGGAQTFSVSGQWRVERALAQTVVLDGLDLYVRSRPTALRFGLNPVPNCARDRANVSWSVSGGVAPVRVWIDGTQAAVGLTRQSLSCSGSAPPRIEAFALGADAAGAAATNRRGPQELEVVSALSAPGQTSVDAVLSWRRVGLAQGYEAWYR
ncbi:MAG: hypothetical protein OXG27_07280, partial [Chloroflexi bacterium]|nr:hypothetical protein [Chloroflexota bacterium]